jgi:hypothetical protein
MLKAGHYTDLLRQVNELKRQLHLVGNVQHFVIIYPVLGFLYYVYNCNDFSFGGGRLST